MKKNDIVETIESWRKIFNLPVRTTPAVPLDKKEIMLALNLIEEECTELEEAIIARLKKTDIETATVDDWVKNDISIDEVADAVADILFVVVQMANIFGLNVHEIVNKVYESNMSKLCTTEEEALESIEMYKDGGIPAFYEKLSDDKFIIKRMGDNKVLKGCNFFTPDWQYDQLVEK